MCARVAQCLYLWFAVMRVWYDVQGVMCGGTVFVLAVPCVGSGGVRMQSQDSVPQCGCLQPPGTQPRKSESEIQGHCSFPTDLQGTGQSGFKSKETWDKLRPGKHFCPHF